MENRFTNPQKAVEKMFEKTALPIDPMTQMSWLHCFVRVFEASNVLGLEPELAVSVVSNTITDIDHCTSTDVRLQHNGEPEMRRLVRTQSSTRF